jgi:hypothetical protein
MFFFFNQEIPASIPSYNGQFVSLTKKDYPESLEK